MKIQLDLEEKTIKIEESIGLHDLFEHLNTLFPDGKWRDFTLVVEEISEWENPINVPNPLGPYNPHDPWTQPWTPSTPSPWTYPDDTTGYPPYPTVWYTTTDGTNDTLGGYGSKSSNINMQRYYNFEIE